MNAVGSNVPAAGVLTAAAAPSALDTVTIGTRVYTYVAGAPAAADELAIPASAPFLSSLIAAIGLTGTAGTDYGVGTTANTQVTAAKGVGDTMVATAIRFGAEGNLIATLDSSAALSWGAATLTGGSGEKFDTEDFIRTDLLVALDDIRTKLTDSHKRLKAFKVGSINLPQANEIAMLRQEGKRHASSLAAHLGSEIRHDVFGSSRYRYFARHAGLMPGSDNYFPHG